MKRLIIISTYLAFLLPLLSQTGGQGQIEFSRYQPLGQSIAVSPTSGDLNYQLPVLTIPGPNGGFSLPLFYQAGVSAHQPASWCGLGWNINAGAITRSVAGLPDDWKNKQRYTSYYKDLGETDIKSIKLMDPRSLIMADKSFRVGLQVNIVTNRNGRSVSSSANIGPLTFDTQNGLGLSLGMLGSISSVGGISSVQAP